MGAVLSLWLEAFLFYAIFEILFCLKFEIMGSLEPLEKDAYEAEFACRPH